jgi:cell division protein FtsL
VQAGELRAWGRQRRTRLITLTSLFLVAAGLFGLVVSHVALTQGQFQLERLERDAADQEARYERLRLEVARLESPERIVAAAQERLGMVPPPEVKYLSPTTAVPAKKPDAVATGKGVAASAKPAASSSDWSTVKRELAARP